MNSEYSLTRSNHKVSKHAFVATMMGIGCLVGYLLLIVASIASIGTIGIMGGFFGCLFLLLSIFGTLWSILWYDEAKTTKKYKKAGIIINVIGIIVGLILFII